MVAVLISTVPIDTQRLQAILREFASIFGHKEGFLGMSVYVHEAQDLDMLGS
jgi:hypothetical protein